MPLYCFCRLNKSDEAAGVAALVELLQALWISLKASSASEQESMPRLSFPPSRNIRILFASVAVCPGQRKSIEQCEKLWPSWRGDAFLRNDSSRRGLLTSTGVGFSTARLFPISSRRCRRPGPRL